MDRMQMDLSDRLELVEPKCGMEPGYRAYLVALASVGETANYAEVLEELQDSFAALVKWFDELRVGHHLPPGYLSQHVYWLSQDGKSIIGEGQLSRHCDRGYSAGFTIHPDERCKGYGTRILALILSKAQMLSADHVWLSCRKDNVASIRIIQRNGGTFIVETPDPDSGNAIARYRIDLCDSA